MTNLLSARILIGAYKSGVLRFPAYALVLFVAFFLSAADRACSAIRRARYFGIKVVQDNSVLRKSRGFLALYLSSVSCIAMDISDSTSTPNDGRPPIEAVAATAAESKVEDDGASGSTAASGRDHRQHDLSEKYDAKDDLEPSKQGPGDPKVDAAASQGKQETKNPHGRSAFEDLQQKLTEGSDGPSRNLRKHWWQIYRDKNPPPPPPATLDDAKTLPLAKVSFLNELLYIWIGPLIMLGKRRPLQVRPPAHSTYNSSGHAD